MKIGEVLKQVKKCIVRGISRMRNGYYNFIYKGVANVNGSDTGFSAGIIWLLRTNYHLKCSKKTDSNRVIVYITDKMHPAGLADRLRTIRTAYACAAENNREFYVYHQAGGFRLEEYFEPNEIDWRIEEDEINFGLKNVALLIRYNTIPQLSQDDREYHLYDSAGILQEFKLTPEQREKYTDYSVSRKLFKPSHRLNELVTSTMKEVGVQEDEYIVIHLRFTNFFEKVEINGRVSSSEEERAQMIRDVHAAMDRIQQASGCDRVILFSDSNVFLQHEHPGYVTILPGISGHVSKHADKAVIDKTFIDMLVMSKAKAVYSIRGKNIYGGGFSRDAAIIGGKPFIEVPLHEGSREGFIGTY